MALLFRGLHATLDRLDDALDRNTAAFERNGEAFDRHAAAYDRNTAAFDDFREAFRQDRLRSERIFQAQMDAIANMRDEIRSHTKAINRVLDRWGEGPTPAP